MILFSLYPLIGPVLIVLLVAIFYFLGLIGRKNDSKWLLVIVLVGILYGACYPFLYYMDKNDKKEKERQSKLAMSKKIEMPKIDPDMMSLIEEKAQAEIAQRQLDANALQSYKKAKEYLDSNYRGSQIVDIQYDGKYGYFYENGIYLISFKAIVVLNTGSFLNKKFIFYLDKDESQPVDNVWEILNFKEENI